MAEYVLGEPGDAHRIGILPSAFNPPTVAHLALAEAAERQAHLDQVVLALPRTFPHKSFQGASLDQRITMVQAVLEGIPARAAALTDGGLFVEIAREFRQISRPGAEIFLICGKDAAERIAGWDYGDGPSFDEQLQEFTLLAADREGRYRPSGDREKRILPIELPQDLSRVSSQTLRDRRAKNQEWQALTVPAVARLIDEWDLYRGPRD